jgi:hypothetical protein
MYLYLFYAVILSAAKDPRICIGICRCCCLCLFYPVILSAAKDLT